MSKSDLVLLIADIHANLSALKAVMHDAWHRYQADTPFRIWFLGDLLGRGPMPTATWRQFMAYQPEVSIAGNHDWGIIGKVKNIETLSRETGPFKARDWRIIVDQRQELVDLGLLTLDESDEPQGGKVFDYLEKLPILYVPYPGIYLVHGGWATALEDNTSVQLERLMWDYVRGPGYPNYTFDVLRWLVKHPEALSSIPVYAPSLELPEVVLVGHYHRRTLYAGNAQGLDWKDPVQLDHPYELHPQPDYPVLISPGGVGFPREIDDRDASYAILEIESQSVRSVTFHKVAFNRKLVRQQMKDKGYPQEVIDYLYLSGEKELETCD